MSDCGMKQCSRCGANVNAKYDVCPICANVFDSDYAKFQMNFQNEQTTVSQDDTKSDMEIGCLCCGIGSLLFCWNFIGLIAAVVGLILAHNAKKKGVKSGLITGGKVCSIISIVFFVIMIIAIIGLIIFGLYFTATTEPLAYSVPDDYLTMLFR